MEGTGSASPCSRLLSHDLACRGIVGGVACGSALSATQLLGSVNAICGHRQLPHREGLVGGCISAVRRLLDVILTFSTPVGVSGWKTKTFAVWRGQAQPAAWKTGISRECSGTVYGSRRGLCTEWGGEAMKTSVSVHAGLWLRQRSGSSRMTEGLFVTARPLLVVACW